MTDHDAGLDVDGSSPAVNGLFIIRATRLYLILYLLAWLNARDTRLYLIIYLLAWVNARATRLYLILSYWPG